MRGDGRRFAQIPEAVLYAEISANAVRLYGILQRHIGRRSPYHPPRSELAALMRASTDTVDRTLLELAGAGLIKVEKRGSFNKYSFPPVPQQSANLPTPQPPTVRKDAESADSRSPQGCGVESANLPTRVRKDAAQLESGEFSSIEEREGDHDSSGWPPEVMSAEWFPEFQEILSWYPPRLRDRPDNVQPAEILAKTYTIDYIREKHLEIMGEPYFLKGWPQEILDAIGRDFATGDFSAMLREAS